MYLCSYAVSPLKVHEVLLLVMIGFLLFVWCRMMRSIADRLDVHGLIEPREQADQCV